MAAGPGGSATEVSPGGRRRVRAGPDRRQAVRAVRSAGRGALTAPAVGGQVPPTSDAALCGLLGQVVRAAPSTPLGQQRKQ